MNDQQKEIWSKVKTLFEESSNWKFKIENGFSLDLANHVLQIKPDQMGYGAYLDSVYILKVPNEYHQVITARIKNHMDQIKTDQIKALDEMLERYD